MRTVSKYLAFARIAAVQTASDRAELFGRMAFVAVILGVFSALWRAVGEAGMPVDADPEALVWYLAATEWILLSPPMIHIVIEGDVRRGDIAYQFQRPYSYLGAIAAQGLGARGSQRSGSTICRSGSFVSRRSWRSCCSSLDRQRTCCSAGGSSIEACGATRPGAGSSCSGEPAYSFGARYVCLAQTFRSGRLVRTSILPTLPSRRAGTKPSVY